MMAKEMHIHLNHLKLFAYHGVLKQENQVGAYYYINLDMATDYTAAAATDDLSGTINYAEVYETVKREMAKPSQLLEHVAYRIAQCLLDEFDKIETIKISIDKENPPMGAECGATGVEAIYTR